MTDQNASGNRWERAGDQPADQTSDENTDQNTDQLEPAAVSPPEATAPDELRSTPLVARDRSWLTRARLVTAGGLGAALLVGGGAGFLVGHATGDGPDGTQLSPMGFEEDGGFGPGGDGSGVPPGQLPDGGTGTDLGPGGSTSGLDDGTDSGTDSGTTSGTDSGTSDAA